MHIKDMSDNRLTDLISGYYFEIELLDYQLRRTLGYDNRSVVIDKIDIIKDKIAMVQKELDSVEGKC
jgi:hypothetical protein